MKARMEEETESFFFPSIFLRGGGGDSRFQDLLGEIH